MHPLQVESAWGAVAALLLLQCMGAILFNGLLYHLGPSAMPATATATWPARIGAKLFLSTWGLGWLGIFLIFEATTVRLILSYFQHARLGPLLHPAGPMSIVKLLLAALFFRLLLTLHYRYPFHKPRGQWLTPVFLIACLAGSSLMQKHALMGGAQIAGGTDAVFGFVMGLVFFLLGCGAGEFFYLFGLLGGGVLVITTCAMLLRGDWLSVESVWLVVIFVVWVLVEATRVRRRRDAQSAKVRAVELSGSRS